MAAKTCVSCGKKIGAFANWQSCQSGCLCQGCYDTAMRYRGDVGYINGHEVAEAVAKVQSNDKLIKEFDESSHLGNKLSGYIAIFDDRTRRVMLPKRLSPIFNEQDFWLFAYDDIVSAELMRGEEAVRVSGLGRAVVGGLLFGVIGAAAGYVSAQDERANPGSDSIEVRVRVKSYSASTYEVHILDGGMRETSPQIESSLKDAIELVEKLNGIAGYTEHEEVPSYSVTHAASGADELRKFKALLDDGIITQEEFDAKKSQILGL